MLNTDFILGLTAILAPFVFVGVVIVRQWKNDKVARNGGASTLLNANGLPMIGGVDVNGKPLGAIDPHLVNVNGLPMIGGVDALGNSFGTYGHTY